MEIIILMAANPTAQQSFNTSHSKKDVSLGPNTTAGSSKVHMPPLFESPRNSAYAEKSRKKAPKVKPNLNFEDEDSVKEYDELLQTNIQHFMAGNHSAIGIKGGVKGGLEERKRKGVKSNIGYN
jgi:hypothetical protein